MASTEILLYTLRNNRAKFGAFVHFSPNPQKSQLSNMTTNKYTAYTAGLAILRAFSAIAICMYICL